jgi:NTE family protein
MKDQPVIGLALGGGAALGWAHIGVIRVLQEYGIEVNVIAGTSIGSLVGACLASGKLDALEDTARAMTRGRLFSLSDLKICKGGLLGGDKIVKELSNQLGAREFEELSCRFATVAADLVTGEEVVITEGGLCEAVRASISVPGLFTPVIKGQALLIDGGLLNTVPVSVCHDLGADFVIGVNVVGDYEGRAAASGLLEEAIEAPSQKKDQRSLFRRRPKKPSLRDIGLTSIAMIIRELARGQHANCPSDIWIEPKVGHIGVSEFHRADELMDLGRSAAKEALPEISAKLGSDSQLG